MGLPSVESVRAGLATTVEQPAPPRRRFGLYSAATVLPMADEGGQAGRWQLGIQYRALDPYVALNPPVWPADLLAAAQFAPAHGVLRKADNRAVVGYPDEWGSANAVPLVVALECPGGPGDSAAEYKARATALLDWNEERLVEATLWSGERGNNQFLANTTSANLTPAGGPVPIADAVSLLSGSIHAGNTLGVFHVPVVALPFIHNYVSAEQNVLRTKLGDAVAVGAGYGFSGPDLSTPPAPVTWRWLYSTGPVVVRRGPVRVYDPYYDQHQSRTITIAERMVSVTVGGYAAAVKTIMTATV